MGDGAASEPSYCDGPCIIHVAHGGVEHLALMSTSVGAFLTLFTSCWVITRWLSLSVLPRALMCFYQLCTALRSGVDDMSARVFLTLLASAWLLAPNLEPWSTLHATSFIPSLVCTRVRH